MEVKVLGVVGSGRMGLALARLLKPTGLDFVFYDSNKEALERASKAGYRVSQNLSGLLEQSDAVMVAVSHSAVPATIRALGRLLASRPSARARLVFDIATFKEGVIGEYQSYPEKVMVASVHPLFGPGARDPRRHSVVVVPVPGREEGSRLASHLFREAGFNVVVASVDEHDEAVAYTIGLSYVIASSLAGALKDKWDSIHSLSGTTFRLLEILMGSIAVDPEDFIAYILSNPQVKRVAAELASAIVSTTRKPEGYVAALKELLAVDSLTLYRALYNCIEGA